MKLLNRIVIVGRLTRDPELRRTNNDVAVTSFTVAVDDKMKGPDGNRSTSFISCVIFNRQAENVAKYCRKGSLVGVDGSVRQRNYERRDGSRGTAFEVVADNVTFLEPKGDRAGIDDSGYVSDEDVAKDDSQNLESIDVAEDDLPF